MKIVKIMLDENL